MFASTLPSTLARPVRLLILVALACLGTGAASAWFMQGQPWLGVKFVTSEDSVIVADVAPHLARALPVGATVLQVMDGRGAALELHAMDLIEEPDFFDSYQEMATFFGRQDALAGLLRSTEVKLAWQHQDGTSGIATVFPGQRPLADLPAVFWFQLLAGCAAFLVSSWVFVLRPGDWGTRMFALTGLIFPFATTSAALYSARELAFPGDLFRTLSSINHAGAMLFGCALVGLFMSYPRQLVRPRHLLWLPAVFGGWLLSDILRIAPDQDWGTRYPVMLEMLLAIVFAAVQWRKSRGYPLDRAALRWFTLSTVLGCSMFIVSVPAASALGYFPPLSQGYSFGFFLIMYLGIALGLRKYRLFDLDEWAYRIFLWVAGAMAVLLMDALLLFFGLGQTTSLGITLLLSGWLYFPFRQWLWRRIVDSNATRFEAVLPEMSGIAFIPSIAGREARWDDLLQRMFDPLEMEKCSDGDAVSAIRSDGLELYVPACGKLGTRILRYAGRGDRLFSSRDVIFANSMCHLMQQIMAGRDSYERGVEQERQRIAQDLHDNIGARILKLIHRLRGTPDADIAREAMQDLRTAIAAIDSPPVPLGDALADWRAEADSRCEAASVQLEWSQEDVLPGQQLQPRVRASIESMLRETITNSLKHAAPVRIRVRITMLGGSIRISVEDDGRATDPAGWKPGYGLRSIRGRLHDLGGKLGIAGTQTGVRLDLEIPLGAGA